MELHNVVRRWSQPSGNIEITVRTKSLKWWEEKSIAGPPTPRDRNHTKMSHVTMGSYQFAPGWCSGSMGNCPVPTKCNSADVCCLLTFNSCSAGGSLPRNDRSSKQRPRVRPYCLQHKTGKQLNTIWSWRKGTKYFFGWTDISSPEEQEGKCSVLDIFSTRFFCSYLSPDCEVRDNFATIKIPDLLKIIPYPSVTQKSSLIVFIIFTVLLF